MSTPSSQPLDGNFEVREGKSSTTGAEGTGDGRSAAVDRLVALIQELKPFLDTSGYVYCELPHRRQENRAKFSIRSRQIRSLLSYRYHRKHGEYPGRERVTEAIEHVEGQLLEHRRGPTIEATCPVLRCFLRAVVDHECGAGSARDILQMLRDTQTIHRILRGAEKLPKNETAMGMWLVTNQQVLRAHGVDIHRPQRGAVKRLWGWRRIVSDNDTCDTLEATVSAWVSPPNSHDGNHNRPNDTLTDEQLLQLIQGVSDERDLQQAPDHGT